MKNYVELQIDIIAMCSSDIITYSNGKDNDIEDDDWFME
jgi:hypothetical protein